MQYDLHLTLAYDYDSPAHGGRHLIRVVPLSIPGVQRVIAASLSIDPKPTHEVTFHDFFGNSVTSIAFNTWTEHLSVRLAARVAVEELQPPADLSPPVAQLLGEIGRIWSLASDSPHHYLGVSPRIPFDPAIAAYGKRSVDRTETVYAAALDLCHAIYHDFDYDPGSTDVGTTPSEAFEQKKGVCQDFAHVMISALRGVGVPAGYVSGFIRTNPPPGKARLEGADAMHAWARVWCGQDLGWLEFDPTNALVVGSDHITIGHGRDYADISPIVGVLKTSGSHEASQKVDVIRLE